jgi:DNA-directed RNA polymerase subunit RPC12/RpoP
MWQGFSIGNPLLSSVVCEDCGQKFANKHRLEIHNEMVHLKGKQLVCQHCGKDFLGKRRLHNHMLSKHPKGQKFVSCEYCGQV